MCIFELFDHTSLENIFVRNTIEKIICTHKVRMKRCKESWNLSRFNNLNVGNNHILTLKEVIQAGSRIVPFSSFVL